MNSFSSATDQPLYYWIFWIFHRTRMDVNPLVYLHHISTRRRTASRSLTFVFNFGQTSRNKWLVIITKSSELNGIASLCFRFKTASPVQSANALNVPKSKVVSLNTHYLWTFLIFFWFYNSGTAFIHCSSIKFNSCTNAYSQISKTGLVVTVDTVVTMAL